MVRYSSSYSARVAARRAAARRKRRLRRWYRKPRASRALILATRALRRLPRREVRAYVYRKPFGIAEFGNGTLNGVGAENLHSLGYEWQIGKLLSPYGASETYWTNARSCTETNPLYYNSYRFPPTSTATTYHDASQGSAANGTRVPGFNEVSGSNTPQHGTSVRNFTGGSMDFLGFQVKGWIRLASNKQLTTEAFMHDRRGFGRYTGNITVYLKIVLVQQFKQVVGEPEISPADVFATPLGTSVTQAPTGNEDAQDPLVWTETALVPGNQNDNEVPKAYDTGRLADDANEATAIVSAVGNGDGATSLRGRKFKVIESYTQRFQFANTDTRRLLSMRINRIFRPAKKRMQVEGTVSVTNTANQMNPVFLWLIPSYSTQTAGTGNTCPGLFECLDVLGWWAEVP